MSLLEERDSDFKLHFVGGMHIPRTQQGDGEGAHRARLSVADVVGLALLLARVLNCGRACWIQERAVKFALKASSLVRVLDARPVRGVAAHCFLKESTRCSYIPSFLAQSFCSGSWTDIVCFEVKTLKFAETSLPCAIAPRRRAYMPALNFPFAQSPSG